MAAQPKSTIHETLFDYFNLIFFYFRQKSVNQKSKKIWFQKHLNEIYLKQNISLTRHLLQGTIIFLLPATRSVEQQGRSRASVSWTSLQYTSPQSSPKLPSPPSQLSHGNSGISKSPMSSSGLGISGYYSRGRSRVSSGSAPSIR